MMDVDDLNLEPIVRAQGVALALIGALLERRAELPAGEFSRLLGIMSVATADADPEAGEILAAWTAIARARLSKPDEAGPTH